MLRKELRRHERQQSLRRRFLAGSTAVVIALGMAVGGTAPAFSAPKDKGLTDPYSQSDGITTYDQGGLVCSAGELSFQKPPALDGSNLNNDGVYRAVEPNNWGSLSWDVSEKRVTWNLNPGWDIDICVKGGTFLSAIDTSALPDGVTSYVHTQAGLSHLGFRIVSTPDDTTTRETVVPTASMVDRECGVAGTYTLDEIEGVRWFIGAIEQAHGTYTVTTATTKVVRAEAISPDFELASGAVDEFTFPFTEPGPCPRDTTTVAPVAEQSMCETGGASILLPPVTGVRWFVNGEITNASLEPMRVLEAGTYTVTAEIDPDATGGPYAFASDAVTTWPFVFTDDDICDLPELPITNASIGFIDPTCNTGQQLDLTQLVAANSLAELAGPVSTSVDGTYEVVFVTTDPDARFFNSSTPVPGRSVSPDGTTLTFTGTLLGPDRSPECVTTVELRDPVSYIDNCIDGGSFTIYRVDGIVYTVFNGSTPAFDVPWADGELTRTYDAQQGDLVRVMPSAESDRYTISPDPAPFERTFARYSGDCLRTLPLTEASVTFSPASCLDATNWLVLPTAVGVEWFVDGEPRAAGSWAELADSDVSVRASAVDGYGFGAETTTQWEHSFAPADEACDLTTLAHTGASNALVGIGFIAVLLTLAGLGGVIGRRSVRA